MIRSWIRGSVLEARRGKGGDSLTINPSHSLPGFVRDRNELDGMGPEGGLAQEIVAQARRRERDAIRHQNNALDGADPETGVIDYCHGVDVHAGDSMKWSAAMAATRMRGQGLPE